MIYLTYDIEGEIVERVATIISMFYVPSLDATFGIDADGDTIDLCLPHVMSDCGDFSSMVNHIRGEGGYSGFYIKTIPQQDLSYEEWSAYRVEYNISPDVSIIPVPQKWVDSIAFHSLESI